MRAISRVAAVGAAIVIIAIGGVGIYVVSQPTGPKGTTTTSTTSSASSTSITTSASSTSITSPPPGVKAAFDAHLSEINARNVPAVLNDYSDNALVRWTGRAAGLEGNYSGVGNIRLLYSAALSTAEQITVTPSSYVEIADSSTQETVTSTLTFTGKSSILGTFNGTVQSRTVFVYSSGAWKIQNESWEYKVFNVAASGGATTFPEWQKVGPINLNRRSTDWLHNFAWDFGGLGAAAIVYITIAVLGLLLVRKIRQDGGENQS